MILTMCCWYVSLPAQNLREIVGTVSDSSGEPLIGVSVLVKESSAGATTDIDGKFRVNAAAGQTLKVSYVGYTTQEIKVSSQSVINIVLKEDLMKLEEVVVVGYGTQKKVNLTGAVSSVTAEELANKPVTSTAQALAGLAPGLSVLQNSGRPGASANVKIRGTGTFSSAGTDPLVLIDGLSGSIDDVNL